MSDAAEDEGIDGLPGMNGGGRSDTVPGWPIIKRSRPSSRAALRGVRRVGQGGDSGDSGDGGDGGDGGEGGDGSDGSGLCGLTDTIGLYRVSPLVDLLEVGV
jgi:hypothetical protein